MSDEEAMGYEPGQFDHEDYVPVAYARDEDQAERLVALLSDHDIPAVLNEESTDAADMDDGIPVFVPPEFAEEAEEIINDYEQTDGFDLDDDELDDDDEEDDDPDAAMLDLDAIELDDTQAGQIPDSLLDDDDLIH